MNDAELIQQTLLWAAIILGIPAVLWGIPALIKRLRGPMTAHVTVSSRRMELAKWGGRWSDNWNRLITFQLKDGSELELYVSQAEYQTIEDGQTGQITWEEDTLIHFDPDFPQERRQSV